MSVAIVDVIVGILISCLATLLMGVLEERSSSLSGLLIRLALPFIPYEEREDYRQEALGSLAHYELKGHAYRKLGHSVGLLVGAVAIGLRTAPKRWIDGRFQGRSSQRIVLGSAFAFFLGPGAGFFVSTKDDMVYGLVVGVVFALLGGLGLGLIDTLNRSIREGILHGSVTSVVLFPIFWIVSGLEAASIVGTSVGLTVFTLVSGRTLLERLEHRGEEHGRG